MALTKQEIKQNKRNWWYWHGRGAATQTELTQRNIEQTQVQLARYYSRTQQAVIEQFEATYNKLLATVADGRQPTPTDLYKLDTYWQMQAQLRDELTRLGDRQAATLSKNFTREYQNIYDALAIKDGTFFNKIDTEVV